MEMKITWLLYRPFYKKIILLKIKQFSIRIKWIFIDFSLKALKIEQ